MPATQTLLTSNYRGKDRAITCGIIGGIVAGAISLGPIIGGRLTNLYTWRLVFALEVVIVFIFLVLSRSILDAPLETEDKPRLHIAGTALSALGVGLIVFGGLLAGTYGWWKARQHYSRGGLKFRLSLYLPLWCLFYRSYYPLCALLSGNTTSQVLGKCHS